MPIDFIISPVIGVARAIGRRLAVPGAFDMIPLAEDRVRTIGVRCTESCPIVNTPLRQLTGLFPDLNIVIVGIIRGDNSFVRSEEHTSELQSLMRISYAVFCLKKKNNQRHN